MRPLVITILGLFGIHSAMAADYPRPQIGVNCAGMAEAVGVGVRQAQYLDSKAGSREICMSYDRCYATLGERRGDCDAQAYLGFVKSCRKEHQVSGADISSERAYCYARSKKLVDMIKANGEEHFQKQQAATVRYLVKHIKETPADSIYPFAELDHVSDVTKNAVIAVVGSEAPEIQLYSVLVNSVPSIDGSSERLERIATND